MPVAPWAETQLRVVVEFKKGSGVGSREIVLTHRPDVLPPQLQGRVHPEVWRAFMVDIQTLASQHPYTQRQTAGQCCWNLGSCFCFLCAGFGIFEPDGGSYAVWYQQVAQALARHQPAFAQGGCRLALQEVHNSHFIQIDIDPNVAVGAPVMVPPMPQPGGPYDPTKPPTGFTGAPPPGAYPAPPPGAYPAPPTGGYPAPPPGAYGGPPPEGYAGQPSDPIKPPAGVAGAPAPGYAGPPPGYGAPPPEAYGGQGYPPQGAAAAPPYPPPAADAQAPGPYPPMK